ncbi:Hypothetical protein AA314_09011 [Archangium gephyra]|uniref:Uncharacterized protein n=1 Tax=Archangium gephyra TaxID=48 RepID=A0AAC8QHU0_9BACT|nr:Hypothetical protein AA314_09011 [Archangium gephyra]
MNLTCRGAAGRGGAWARRAGCSPALREHGGERGRVPAKERALPWSSVMGSGPGG